MTTLIRRLTFAVVALLTLPGVGRAEVIRVDVTSRTDVAFGYEKIVARVHFAVDPKNPRNAVVIDLDKAPKNAQGLVEFTADLYLLKPKIARPDAAALVDIVNRGNRTVLSGFDRPRGSNSPDPELGDGFLMQHGFTIVAVGWEFDVASRGVAMRIDVPVAMDGNVPMTSIVTAPFEPNQRATDQTVGDLAGYQPADPNGPETMLTVRDSQLGKRTTIARGKWTLKGNVVSMASGFEPGLIYELSYRTASLPIAGLGLAAVRDVSTWVKHDAGALASAKYLYAFGESQSGRFLRSFLYEGFNADEHGRQVFDGMMAHIAGSSRLVLNQRGSMPTTLAMFTATSYPFATTAEKDPVSGASEGLFDNARTRAVQPKMMVTNTGVEYWGGGRVAALEHTAPDGSRDLALPENVRVYFLAGAQHSPGAFPPAAGLGQQSGNPMDYWWTLRALLVSMDRWVRDGVAPPASQYPRLDQHTLVKAADVAFPKLPQVQAPNGLNAGERVANVFIAKGAGAGAPLPLLVPQVNADGNETTGIRQPDLAVPLATYTGWNFRKASIGGSDRLYPLIGSYIPFAKTKAERESRGDPRLSIEERYPSKDAYLSQVKTAAAGLVKDRYLLADDVTPIVTRAEQQWDWLAGSASR